MTRLERGLIVRQPWIDEILVGRKTWEMRGKATSVRGPIALIQQGAGLVVGVANIIGTRGPLTHEELLATFDQHRITPDYLPFAEANGWTVAWEMKDIQKLVDPIPYEHPKGAVTWVRLASAELERIETEIRRSRDASRARIKSTRERKSRLSPRDELVQSIAKSKRPTRTEISTEQNQGRDLQQKRRAKLAPVARDGTWFGPHLRRNGAYTIGAKGSEQRVVDYESALNRLRQMTSARWRRPNANGNWGIVTAVDWQPIDRLTNR